LPLQQQGVGESHSGVGNGYDGLSPRTGRQVCTARGFRALFGEPGLLPASKRYHGEGVGACVPRESGGTDTPTPGAYSVTFSVSDGTTVVSQTITISVTHTNRPPALSPVGNQAVQVGSSLVIVLSATDPDSDSLTYSAARLPRGASFNPATLTFSWTPTKTGSWTVTFAVSDGAFSDSEAVTITVTAPQQRRVRRG